VTTADNRPAAAPTIGFQGNIQAERSNLRIAVGQTPDPLATRILSAQAALNLLGIVEADINKVVSEKKILVGLWCAIGQLRSELDNYIVGKSITTSSLLDAIDSITNIDALAVRDDLTARVSLDDSGRESVRLLYAEFTLLQVQCGLHREDITLVNTTQQAVEAILLYLDSPMATIEGAIRFQLDKLNVEEAELRAKAAQLRHAARDLPG
jgi:hypothetical protein